MANGLDRTVFPQIQRIFQGETLAGLSDGQLLERFASRNDEASFEALMARYGPLVLSVCRNMLRDRDDVDDAFQATFLVLVRKAGSIRLEGSLGSWIYAVAFRVAARSKANRTLRHRRENAVLELNPLADPEIRESHDVLPLLHEELSRLPERLRSPIVLCYFQGLTHELAAQRLRWPVGTVRSRMARARALLRDRLTRRGLTLSAGFLTASTRLTGAEPIPPRLWAESSQAAMRIGAGRATEIGVISTKVAALTEGVLTAMSLTKLKAAAWTLLIGVITGCMTALAVQPPDKPASTKRPHTEQVNANADASVMESTFKRAYEVDDLLILQVGQRSAEDAHPIIDYRPIIDLIISTVAPGTWQVGDAIGGDVASPFPATKSGEKARPIGSIVPFFMTKSLIIRHTAEVHDEVAARLLQMHYLMHGRHKNSGEPSGATKEPTGSPPEPAFAVVPAKRGERVRKLLEELEGEIDDLVRERERLHREAHSNKNTKQ